MVRSLSNFRKLNKIIFGKTIVIMKVQDIMLNIHLNRFTCPTCVKTPYSTKLTDFEFGPVLGL